MKTEATPADHENLLIWVWVNTYRYIFNGTSINPSYDLG